MTDKYRIILNDLDFGSSISLCNKDGTRCDKPFTPSAVVSGDNMLRGFFDVEDAAYFLKSKNVATVRYISGNRSYSIPTEWVGDGESISDRLTENMKGGTCDYLNSDTLLSAYRNHI